MSTGCRTREERELDDFRAKFESAEFENEKQEIERICKQRKDKKAERNNREVELDKNMIDQEVRKFVNECVLNLQKLRLKTREDDFRAKEEALDERDMVLEGRGYEANDREVEQDKEKAEIEEDKKHLKDFDSRLIHLTKQLEEKEGKLDNREAELNRFEASLQARERRLNQQELEGEKL